MNSQVHIIGAGLAGCEAAWQIAKKGFTVTLYEMRPYHMSPAHVTGHFAELVCSNSFRSDDEDTAIGLLHYEMRKLDSLIMKCADKHRVPAGSALAVDRVAFSQEIEKEISALENITIVREEVIALPEEGLVIIATGPLTSDNFSKTIQNLIGGQEYLAFFDAIAPIVYYDSIDFNIAWKQSRYDKGGGDDYINLPLTKDQYYSFVQELLAGEKGDFREWEENTPYFNGCLPIEVMAERGMETLRYGPMKPVGLTNPHSSEKPYAVVQLRRDNKEGSLYNMVGFQTKLKYKAQKEIFSKIPGLERAEFARFGGMHRNTFIASPTLLDSYLRLCSNLRIRFAGQITGVEGYIESAAIGLLAGLYTAYELRPEGLSGPDLIPPRETALGSLIYHIIAGAEENSFQPMNINFGLFLPLEKSELSSSKLNRKVAYSQRAKSALAKWLQTHKT